MAKVDLLPALGRPRRRRRLPALLALAGAGAALAAWLAAGSFKRPLAEVVPHGPDPRAAAGQVRLETRPLAEWLDAVAADAGRALVIAPGVESLVSARLPETLDWRRRLDALAAVEGFGYHVADDLIEVFGEAASAEPAAGDEATGPGSTAPANEAVAEQAADPAEEHAGHGGTEAADETGRVPTGAGRSDAADPGRQQNAAPCQVAADPIRPEDRRSIEVIRVANGRAERLATLLSEVLDPAGVRVAADPLANAIVAEGPGGVLDRIGELVETLDAPARRFLLEAEIVELGRSARDELGVEWKLEGEIGAESLFPGSTGDGERGSLLVATSGAHALRARLSALEEQGRVRVVSRPRIVVMEDREATIESVRILRVRLPEQTAIVEHGRAGDGRAVEEFPVGVTLRVRTYGLGDGRVGMQIEAKSSTLGRPQPPDSIPEELSRRVQAEVVVASGETAVLGGLLREGNRRERAGVPVLGAVPGVGRLFGRRGRAQESEELVVLVTPTRLE